MNFLVCFIRPKGEKILRVFIRPKGEKKLGCLFARRAKKNWWVLVQIENTEILEYWKYWNTEFFLSTILVIFKKRFEQYWITELISGKAGGQAGKKYWITGLISEKPVGGITEFFQQRPWTW